MSEQVVTDRQDFEAWHAHRFPGAILDIKSGGFRQGEYLNLYVQAAWLTWKDVRAECRDLQSRLDAAEQALKASDLRLAQADYNYDMDRNQWRQQLAERDALLRDWLETDLGKSSPAINDLRRKTDYLLSASAEPAKPGFPVIRYVRAHSHTCANVQPGSTDQDVCNCGAVVNGVAVELTENVNPVTENASYTASSRENDTAPGGRRYHVIVVRDSTGEKTYMTRSPVTHTEGCVLLSKITDYPWRRKLLEEVPRG